MTCSSAVLMWHDRWNLLKFSSILALLLNQILSTLAISCKYYKMPKYNGTRVCLLLLCLVMCLCVDRYVNKWECSCYCCCFTCDDNINRKPTTAIRRTKKKKYKHISQTLKYWHGNIFFSLSLSRLLPHIFKYSGW